MGQTDFTVSNGNITLAHAYGLLSAPGGGEFYIDYFDSINNLDVNGTYVENGDAQINFALAPEPSTGLYLFPAVAGLIAWKRFRRVDPL